MPATLKNVSKQPVTVILDQPALLTPELGWQRTTAKFGTTDDAGQRHVSEVRRSLPGTLMLMPGEAVADLPNAIAKCSQVPNLVASRVLELTYQQPEKAKAQPKKDVKKDQVEKK
jgi:hypothetical protein